jgi:Uma2 family endonuclease
MVALPDRLFMSAAEYLDWEPTQEDRYEYWDGEVVLRGSGLICNYNARNHNHISGNWFKLIDDALINRDCDVYIADVKVQVEPGRKYFYPDVVVTCDKGDDDAQIVQFPCLIIEVLSPSTEAIDRGTKFSRYRQFQSLQEYVLVQVDRPKVEVFRRNDRNQWVLSEYDLDDRLLLESIGVEIAISDLYRQVQFETDKYDP